MKTFQLSSLVSSRIVIPTLRDGYVAIVKMSTSATISLSLRSIEWPEARNGSGVGTTVIAGRRIIYSQKFNEQT